MKDIESDFKLVEHFFVRGVKHCVVCLDILFWFKTKDSVLAAIVIPCLLQFLLVAFGQDVANGVNGGHMLLEVSGKSVQGKRIIGDSRDAVGE